MRKDTLLKASQTEKTDFSELSASFQIADGVARNRDLELKSPLLRLTGATGPKVSSCATSESSRSVAARTIVSSLSPLGTNLM